MTSFAQERMRKFLVMLGIVSLHLLILALLGHVVLFREPTPAAESRPPNFQMVKIAAPLPPVPPPPPELPRLPATAQAGGSQTSLSPTAIRTATSATFRLPELPSTEEMLARLPKPSSGAGNGTVSGDGTGPGDGNDDESDQLGLLGKGIKTKERIAVVLDVSGSMKSFNQTLQDYLKTNYDWAKFYPSQSAIGGSMPLTAMEAPYDNGIYSTDLYANVYSALKDKPDAIVIISDFEDGDLPEATAALIDTLRKNHARLVVLSREMAPYPGLAEYSQESGGSFSFVAVDAHAQRIRHILPNARLPESQPLASIYSLMNEVHYRHRWYPRERPGGGLLVGLDPPYNCDPLTILQFIHDELISLTDPHSNLRETRSTLSEQNQQDDILRRLIYFCIKNEPPFSGIGDLNEFGQPTWVYPTPNIVQLQVMLQRINGELLRSDATQSQKATAAHLTQQVMRVALETNCAPLLRLLPDPLKNTAACAYTIPTQNESNAEEVVLTCDESIDHLHHCPRQMVSAISGAIALTQGSKIDQVQAAGRYLKFLFGDQAAFAECLTELDREKDNPLGLRLLKHITLPDSVTTNKIDFILQHRKAALYDLKHMAWKIPNLALNPSYAVGSTITP